MSNVFQISVRRSRSAQPRDYENSTAEVSLKAELSPGEDWRAAVDELLDASRDAVFRNLGLSLPARAGDETAAAVPQGGSSTTSNSNAGNTGDNTNDSRIETTEQLDAKYSAADLKSMIPNMSAEMLKLASKSKYKTVASKAQALLNESAETDVPDDGAGSSKTSDAADVPDDNAGSGNKTSDTSDVPDDGATSGADNSAKEAEVSAEDVQAVLTKAVKEQGLKTDRAKEIIGSFGVSRAKDISTPEDRAAFVRKINEEVSESKAPGLDDLY